MVDATAAWWCVNFPSVLQESVPSSVEHGPGGTRCRQGLAAARRHDCAGAPTGAGAEEARALKAGTRGNARRLSAAAEKAGASSPSRPDASSGRVWGAWAGVQRSADVLVLLCLLLGF